MPGVLVSMKDLIVRARFDDDPPNVNELVVVDNGFNTTLLVDHLEPGGIAFCLNIRTDKRMTKGMAVQRTYKGIEVPLGEATIGRIMNALGDPLDGGKPVDPDVPRKDVMKLPPRSTNFS